MPGQVDGVVDAGRRAADVLGPDAEVGVVADRDREPERLGQHRARPARPATRGWAPGAPGRRAGGPCRAPRRPAPTTTASPLDLGEQLRADLRDRRGHVPLPAGPATVAAVPAGQHRAAEADPGHGQVGDADVDRQHLHALRTRAARRATAGRRCSPCDGRLRPAGLLPHQAGGDQLAGEVADGAAVEPEHGGELGCAAVGPCTCT